MREKNNQLKEELATKDGFIDNLKSQLGEKENAIAKLKSELEVREDIQLNLFPPESNPTPEPETENTESLAVAPEPITIQTEAPDTTNPPETDPGESELLTVSQLAKKVNEKLEEIRKENKEKGLDENHNLPKPLKDYSLRDWFKKGSVCTDKYRAEKQEEYGFKFSHRDKKGTLWFTVG